MTLIAVEVARVARVECWVGVLAPRRSSAQRSGRIGTRCWLLWCWCAVQLAELFNSPDKLFHKLAAYVKATAATMCRSKRQFFITVSHLYFSSATFLLCHLRRWAVSLLFIQRQCSVDAYFTFMCGYCFVSKAFVLFWSLCVQSFKMVEVESQNLLLLRINICLYSFVVVLTMLLCIFHFLLHLFRILLSISSAVVFCTTKTCYKLCFLVSNTVAIAIFTLNELIWFGHIRLSVCLSV